MMSVKHISLSGHEQIHSAESLHFTPALESADGTTGSAAVLRLNRGEASTELRGGTAFVMNEQGRTIARYDLGASMVPLRRRA